MANMRVTRSADRRRRTKHGRKDAIRWAAAAVGEALESRIFLSRSDPTLPIIPAPAEYGGIEVPAFQDDSSVPAIAVQTDGKILIAQRTDAFFDNQWHDYQVVVMRLKPDLSLDLTFGVDGFVALAPLTGPGTGPVLTLQPDGRILVGAACWGSYSGSDDPAIARLSPDGQIDSSFGEGGICYLPDYNNGHDYVRNLSVLSSGDILVAYESQLRYESPDNASDEYPFPLDSYDVVTTRVTADGHLDTSYNGGRTAIDFQPGRTLGGDSLVQFQALSDGSAIALVSSWTDWGSGYTGQTHLISIDATGIIDESFDSQVSAAIQEKQDIHAFVRLPDGSTSLITAPEDAVPVFWHFTPGGTEVTPLPYVGEDWELSSSRITMWTDVYGNVGVGFASDSGHCYRELLTPAGQFIQATIYDAPVPPNAGDSALWMSDGKMILARRTDFDRRFGHFDPPDYGAELFTLWMNTYDGDGKVTDPPFVERDQLQVIVTGGGVAELTGPDQNCLTLTGTTPQTALTVNVVKGTDGDGRYHLSGITSDGPLKRIVGRSIFVDGDVTLNTLRQTPVDGRRVSIRLGGIVNGSIDTGRQPLGSLTLLDWGTTDGSTYTLTAPSAVNISIKGRKDNPRTKAFNEFLPGNLAADVVLEGDLARRLTVEGELSHATTIGGNAGHVFAGSITGSVHVSGYARTVKAEGLLGGSIMIGDDVSIISAGWIDSELSARSFNLIRTTAPRHRRMVRTMAGSITATGASAKGVAIGAISSGGSIADLTVVADHGSINMIRSRGDANTLDLRGMALNPRGRHILS